MLRLIGCAAGLLLTGGFCLVLLILLPLLAVMPTLADGTPGTSEQGGWITPGALSSVVASAQTLQQHVSGPLANQYDATDPVLVRARQYWASTCTVGGELCPEAQSGNLQCVLFVSAAFALAGDPLPALGNAVDFWALYQGRAGWSQIGATASPQAARGLPRPGDLMVWAGGEHLENGQSVAYGHIALVVRVVRPAQGHDGAITVAQANAPGNQLAHRDLPGNFYTLPLHADLSVPGWSAFTTASGVAYGSYTVLGYLRQATPKLLLPTGLPHNNAAVEMAQQAALSTGINVVLFLRQINRESGFDPKARSVAGAQGIAQLLPTTAKTLGVDPWKPQEALTGAARLMAQYHQRYGGDDAKALAAYNAGVGTVDQAMQRCGLAWAACVPEETRQYLQAIL
jgi:hypothetical protein